MEGARMSNKLLAIMGVLAILCLSFLLGEPVGLAGGAEALFTLDKALNFSLDQSVNGQGYFMSYKYARMENRMGPYGIFNNGVESLDYQHGSGTLQSDLNLNAIGTHIKEGVNEVYGLDYQEATSKIEINDSTAAFYSPAAIALGNGFFASNPIRFNSLLQQNTMIKNRGSGTYMSHEVGYARGLDKNLKLLVYEFQSEEDPEITMMNISEDVYDGKAHIGVLQGHPSLVDKVASAYNKSAVVSPLIDFDEDYIGSFHIEKRMNITAIFDLTQDDDDWISCCSGGFNDMADTDRFGLGERIKGIFDCSCFDDCKGLRT
jgi:hypothetical protein